MSNQSCDGGKKSCAVAARIALEKKIVRKVIDSALKLGFSMSVDDGEELVLCRSKEPKKIMDTMFSVDEERLYFHREDGSACRSVFPEMTEKPDYVGWVFFVYGNDGDDVISDYIANSKIEEIFHPVNKFLESLN